MTSIYALQDPDTLAYVYVGKAKKLPARYAAHTRLPRFFATDVQRWAEGLRRRMREPRCVEVERVLDSDAFVAEMRWIKFFIACGFKLLNRNRGCKSYRGMCQTCRRVEALERHGIRVPSKELP